METEDLINLRLLSHPLNWLIVWTVLAFAGAMFMLVHRKRDQINNPSVTTATA